MKKAKLKAYCEMTKKMIKSFESCKVEYTPRENSTHADALARMVVAL